MNTNRIYIGNIMCDKGLYKENAVLLYHNRKFIDISETPYYFAKKYKKENNHLMWLSTKGDSKYYISTISLRPYYDKRYHKSLKKVYEDIKTNN